MKTIASTTLVALILMTGYSVHAETGHAEQNIVLGGRISFGLGMSVGNGYAIGDLDFSKAVRGPMFSLGNTLYFNYYFNDQTGIEVGAGFAEKGVMYRWDSGDAYHVQTVVLETPILLKLDFDHIQVGLGAAFFYTFKGSTDARGDGVVGSYDKWIRGDEYFDRYNEHNFGPYFTFGYAVPVGPLFIVPSATWTMHVLSDLFSISGTSDKPQTRGMNLMFNIGAEVGI